MTVEPLWEEFPAPVHAEPLYDESDPELTEVYSRILSLDPDGSRFSKTIRRTFDMLLDGPNTGRYRWDQLYKTEKTHCGTVIEINLQREFGFENGDELDYKIAGVDVDCKFSEKIYRWMIPPIAVGKIMLVVWASDQAGKWSVGLVRADDHVLRRTENWDRKVALNVAGKNAVRWVFKDKPLPGNLLLRIPQHDIDQIFSKKSGQQRLNELVRRVQGRLLTRNVVCTVATANDPKPRLDPLRRLRDGAQGARGQLCDEGIMILGDYASHSMIASTLRLPVPGPSEFVSVRMARRKPHHADAPFVVLEGDEWVIALPSDPIERAPVAPISRIRRSSRGSAGTSRGGDDLTDQQTP